ncbi:MAG: polyphenol oxidase family protein [Bacillota bacterium]
MRPHWIRLQTEDVAVWRIEGWEDLGFLAQFVTRRGGFSEGHFASLNLATGLGDNPRWVRLNRDRVTQRLLPAGTQNVQVLRQIHGTEHQLVPRTALGEKELGWWLGPEGDALIGSHPSITLATFHADCLPVYLIHPCTGYRALVHAGWGGLVAGVIQRSVAKLLERADTEPHHLHAALGPCIEREAYEIGTDVVRGLAAAPFNWRDAVYPGRRGRFRLDLKRAAAGILCDLGLPRDHLVTDAPGTFGNAGDFYSHRRDGTTGRCVALLGALVENAEECAVPWAKPVEGSW